MTILITILLVTLPIYCTLVAAFISADALKIMTDILCFLAAVVFMIVGMISFFFRDN
jgi:hypothetical protein